MPRPRGILWERFERVQEAGGVAAAKYKKCFRLLNIFEGLRMYNL